MEAKLLIRALFVSLLVKSTLGSHAITGHKRLLAL
jgi:hypothetical protein